MRVSTLVERMKGRALGELARYSPVDPRLGMRVSRIPNLEKIGSRDGGWVVPTDLLGPDSICYCAGVGEDITFDLGLLKHFSCDVYAFDPTPRAKLHVQRHAAGEKRLHFVDLGLWDTDEVMRFYAPSNPKHVNHSIVNLQNTASFFEARCRRLSTMMLEYDHSRLNLLKLDIEGAEYKVLESIVQDRLEIDIVCVEYDELHDRLDDRYLARIKSSLTSLIEFGYTLVAADRDNYTLVKTNLIPRPRANGSHRPV